MGIIEEIIFLGVLVHGKYYEISLELEHSFITARKNIKTNTAMVIELQKKGSSHVGFGECVVADYFGDTCAAVKADLDRALQFLKDWDDIFAIETLNRTLKNDLKIRNSSRSAIIMAFYDLVGKELGVPLYKLWGFTPPSSLISTFTIGIDSPDIVRKKAEAAKKFPLIKIKLGSEKDIELLEIIKNATNARFIVDANCGWTPAKLQSIMDTLKNLGVELIEQPFPPNEEQGYKKLKETSSIPIFADESLGTVSDLKKIEPLFHGINIKLVKCGGLFEALSMIYTAKALDLKIMIGCMIESSISISAASHLSPVADFIDLDGNILIKNDPFDGVKNNFGKLTLPFSSGLGVKRK